MAAIATLDAAVVESGGEVITLADRQAAITELDAAVEAEASSFARLSQAVAEAQRVHAWDADEGFAAALAAGAITIDTNVRGWSEGPFSAWVQHRYPNWASPTRAREIGRAGAVVSAIDRSATGAALPQAERQVRPLARLLAKHEDSIPGVWQQARAEADDYLARHPGKGDPVARYADGIVREQWPELFEKSADDLDAELDRKIRQFRTLFRDLHGRMNHSDFADRVIGWINEEVAE